MKTLLVATDFSAVATNAAHYAVDMAKATGAEVCLFHTYQVPVSYSEVPVAFNLEELAKDAEKQVKQSLQQLNAYANGEVKVFTEIRMGDFFQELKDFCQKLKPYAVVMGTQGSTASERFFFGSHTIYTMRHLVLPIIAVPPTARFSSVKKIGLACDLEEVVKTLPETEIKRLVRDFNAELHVLNTGRSKEFRPETVFESGLLQEMIGSLNPQYHFITNDDTDEGIIEFVDNNHIDLLIVLPKRHQLIEKLTRRSHTKGLVLHSHVPVMALHQ